MRNIMGIFSFLFGLNSNQAIADVKDYDLIDVRTPQEYSLGHVEGAKNFNVLDSNFKNNISNLNKSKSYKLYCQSGNRSGQAKFIMDSMGFKNVENIGGVYQASKKLNRKIQN